MGLEGKMTPLFLYHSILLLEQKEKAEMAAIKIDNIIIQRKERRGWGNNMERQ